MYLILRPFVYVVKTGAHPPSVASFKGGSEQRVGVVCYSVRWTLLVLSRRALRRTSSRSAAVRRIGGGGVTPAFLAEVREARRVALRAVSSGRRRGDHQRGHNGEHETYYDLPLLHI